MKKTIYALLGLIFCLNVNGQTSLFLEDFETSPLMVSSSSGTGTGMWALTSSLSANGTMSDSAVVVISDTLILETNAFSTMGFPFVNLEFSQICKIDFFDRALIEYSTDNGMTWTQLTSAEYTGSGFLNADAFSSVSYQIWDAINGTAIPQNTWWQQESFDISAAGNQAQVKVRFLLIDADNNGSRNNYGWLLDDIEILGSPCELVPPTITLTGTIFQGSVFGTGPYNIMADIQDASGIASADLSYTTSAGGSNTLSMTNTGGNIYQATIPAQMIGDTVWYSITAVDNTTCSNSAVSPASGMYQFEVNASAPSNCVGTPVSNFDYLESFASFTPGNGQNTVGSLANNWENSTMDTHDWFVLDRATNSNGTGPSQDTSQNDANYMYVEASGQFNNETAILNTPCFNLGGLNAPKFSFWYHMFGQNMGELHVDLNDGNSWTLDITPALVGNQGNRWQQREIDLSAYSGTIVQLRFRALTGINFQSDIAIDDIEIIEPPANDIALNSIISPNPLSCNGSANELITVEVENRGFLDVDTVPLAYQVNGGTTVRDTIFTNIPAGATLNHTFQQSFNMSMPGSYSIDTWSELPLDGTLENDSIFSFTVSTNSLITNFPDTNNFDNFTVGTPGVFLDGWANSANNSFDWFVNSGNTPSNGTGPLGDTTTAAGTGNYLYYEATGTPQGEESSLLSGCYDISSLNRPELSFFFNMRGGAMGELHFDIVINGFLVQDISAPIIGDQGSAWQLRVIDLTPFKGEVRLIFRGIRGNGFQSDIAIDQVAIRDAMPVGLESIIQDENIANLYPNPFANQLTVDLPKRAEIEINSITGKRVYSSILGEGQHQLNLSFLENGVYLISVVSDDNKTVRKIIKNN